MIKIFHNTVKSKKLKRLRKIVPNSWIYAVNPRNGELEKIAKECGLDLGLLKDALDPYEVPRVQTEADITYVFTRAPHKSEDEITTVAILIAISDRHIITVSRGKFAFLEEFISGKIDFSTTQKIKFFIQMFAKMNEDYNEFLSEISRQVRSTRARLKKISHKEIIQFVDYEKIANDFLSALVPTNTMLHNLLSGRHLRLYEKDQDLIQDLFLSNKQLIEMCTSTLKSIVNIRDAYSTIMTHDTNRVIKFLTSLTIILTIPAIISGIYGMNVSLPLQDSPFAFLVITVGMLVVMYALAFIFLRKDWL